MLPKSQHHCASTCKQTDIGAILAFSLVHVLRDLTFHSHTQPFHARATMKQHVPVLCLCSCAAKHANGAQLNIANYNSPSVMGIKQTDSSKPLGDLAHYGIIEKGLAGTGKIVSPFRSLDS